MTRQQAEKICPTCCCSGREVRKIEHPWENVYGWNCVSWDEHIYERTCKRCNGSGFVPIGRTVPAIPKDAP